VTELVERRG